MQYIMITGSNRGVGLALVKEYLSREDSFIFATCRNPDSADELQALKAQNSDSLSIVALDINENASIEKAFESISAQTNHLDLLINNAGIYPKTPENVSFGHLTSDALSHVISTNSVSPVMVTQVFIDLLKQGNNPRVVMISSRVGSITLAGSNGFSYRMSKAALNMATKILSLLLVDDGITVVTTHPGWVSTDMGGSEAPVTPSESATGLVKVIDNLTLAQSGKFFNYTGEEFPW